MGLNCDCITWSNDDSFVFLFMDSFGLLVHILVAARENPSGSNFDSWPRSQTCCAETLQSRTTMFNIHIEQRYSEGLHFISGHLCRISAEILHSQCSIYRLQHGTKVSEAVHRLIGDPFKGDRVVRREFEVPHVC